MTEAYRLPLLSGRRAALENCGYCPKLCRAACPVSNATPRDTLTPWGKMSTAWFAARGVVPVDEAHAAVAWACTGCYACRDRCDHRNPVAQTLGDARAEFFARGVAPEGARRVVSEFGRELDRTATARAQLAQQPGVRSDAPTALVIGCGYLRWHPAAARDALSAVVKLAGPVRLADGCCGAPLLYAGDREWFSREQRRLLESTAGSERMIVVDPGCARMLESERPITLVELAARELGRLSLVPELADGARWHDPCQLGRGLGVFEPPRQVLAAAIGGAPREFDRRRDGAACSGAGGLLPSTMPETSRQIAADRLREHERLGGGTLVTACASSLRRLSASGQRVIDLASVIAQSLGRDDERGA